MFLDGKLSTLSIVIPGEVSAKQPLNPRLVLMSAASISTLML